MKKFNYKLTTKNGSVLFTEATDEKKARTSFQRKRNKYRDSWSSVAQGTLECLGETQSSKVEESPLVEILKKETIDMKAQYINLTKKWARNQFEYIVKKTEWTKVDWCDYFGLTPLNEDFPKNFHNTKAAREYDTLIQNAYKIKGKGFSQYEQKLLNDAEKHYNNTILKLATRIVDKGLDVENIKVQSARVGVNLDSVITDGKQTIHAWTIIAEGPVQRPHYRYLIK